MQSRQSRILVLLISVTLLTVSGCGRDKRPAYVASEEFPVLRVPPDLSQPESSREFAVSGHALAELAGHRDADRPPRVLPSDEARQARSRIRSGPGGLLLEVDDDPDSVFQRLALVLNRDGMNVLSVDREQQRYVFRFTDVPEVERRRGLRRMAFWRRPVVIDHSGEYQVRLQAAGRRTQVQLQSVDGGVVALDPAEALLELLQQRLG